MAGRTFLSDIAHTTSGDKRHLLIVIAELGLDYLVVPVNTWKDGRKGQDDSCILDVGDHPFIKHRSWINYRRAKVISAITLINGLNSGKFIIMDDLRKDIVDYISAKAQISIYLPHEYMRFFKQ